MNYIKLNNNSRSIIEVEGNDIVAFFQNLVTNDIHPIKNNQVIYTALLSPQGKYLNDFFIFGFEGKIFIDCHSTAKTNLIENFSRYLLRTKLNFTEQNNWSVFLTSEKDLDFNFIDKSNTVIKKDNLIFYKDPRNHNLGIRVIGKNNFLKKYFKENNLKTFNHIEYENIRIKNCIPESNKDLEINKSFILEYGFDEINGVSFDKGCYIGQENTARLKYRGKIKRKLKLTKLISGKMPTIGSKLYVDNKEIGTMKSSSNTFGLALLKMNYLNANQNIISDNKAVIKIM